MINVRPFPNLRKYPDEGTVYQEKANEIFLNWAIEKCKEQGRPTEDAYRAAANAKAMRAAGMFQPSEIILGPSGTIISVSTEDGIAPGASLEELLKSNSDIYYQLDAGGEFAKTFYGAEGSEFDFGETFDSTDGRFTHVLRVVDILEKYLENPEINRIVILCGTDTFGYILAALTQMVKFPTARIVLTCSMLPPGAEGSDAGPNVHRARYIADRLAWDDTCFVAAFGNRVIDPRRISKVHSTRADPFESPGALDIGELEVDEDRRRWLNNRTVPTLRECHEYASACAYALKQKFLAWTTNQLDARARLAYQMTPEEEMFRLIASQFPDVEEYLAKGGEIDRDDMLQNRITSIDRSYDNSSLWEELNDSYNPVWLEDLLSNPALKGMILSGIESLSPEKHKEVVDIIKRHSSDKPIIIFQDPAAIEPQKVQDLQNAAVEAGAFLSQRMTIEWSTILLKRLLAQTTDPNKMKELWKDGEKIGVPQPIKNFKTRQDDEELPSIGSLKNAIRIVNVNFDHPPEFLEEALMRDDVKGVVVRGFGPGNLPAHLAEVMERVAAVKPCIIASLIDGPQNSDYATGNRAIKIGMFPAKNLGYIGAAQRLDSLLSFTSDLSKIRELWGE